MFLNILLLQYILRDSVYSTQPTSLSQMESSKESIFVIIQHPRVCNVNKKSMPNPTDSKSSPTDEARHSWSDATPFNIFFVCFFFPIFFPFNRYTAVHILQKMLMATRKDVNKSHFVGLSFPILIDKHFYLQNQIVHIILLFLSLWLNQFTLEGEYEIFIVNFLSVI